MKVLETFTEVFEIGSREIKLETGKRARYANGAVVLGMGETKVLSTACSSKSDGVRDFLPLTVCYRNSFIECIHISESQSAFQLLSENLNFTENFEERCQLLTLLRHDCFT